MGMYTIGLDTDTKYYFSGVTILLSLLRTNSLLFVFLFLLMFTIGGSTGVIIGNTSVDLILHDTYYIIAHFHFVLSLGAVIAILSGIAFNNDKIIGGGYSINNNILLSPVSNNSIYNLILIFIGIIITFLPMNFLGFNVMPRRIPDYPDTFISWNFLSSIGSVITILSFGILEKKKS